MMTPEQALPFDLARTTHIFEKLNDGGVQTVWADNPADTAQVQLNPGPPD